MSAPRPHSKILQILCVLFFTIPLTVQAQTPENDDPCPTDANPPIDLTGLSFHTGTTCEATFDYTNLICVGDIQEASVWYNFTPNPTDNGYDITLSPAGGADDAEGPIAVEVFKGSANQGCTGFTELQLIKTSCSDLSTTLKIPNNFAAGEIIHIKISTEDDINQCGEFTISVAAASCGDFADVCSDITLDETLMPVTDNGFQISYSCIAGCLEYASPDASIDGCTEFAENPTVWYKVESDGMGQQLFTSVFTNGVWQPVWSVYKGDDCGALELITASGNTCSNQDVTPDLFQVQLDPLFDTYWIAVSVDPNSIPPDGISDGTFEICASTVINGIVCVGSLEGDCADNSLVIEVTEREVEGASLDGPFCPGETVSIHIEFFFDASETDSDWLSGIIPKFGSGWDVANVDFDNIPKPMGNGEEAGWYEEGGDCAPLIQEDVAHLCTYYNEDGQLTLCNNLCEPCADCPSLGMSIDDPLPSGYFWVTNGASAGCENDCSPSEGWGIGSTLVQVEWDFELTVKQFDTYGDCYANDDLQISFQTFSQGIVGCWEDPVGECIIDKSQFGPVWQVACNYPPNVAAENEEICSNGTTNIEVNAEGGATTTIQVEFIENPNISGATNHTFPSGSGFIVDELFNPTTQTQVMQYIAYTENPSISCLGNEKIIEVTVYPAVNSYLSPATVACEGECITLIPEEIFGGTGGPYNYLWNTGQITAEILACPTVTSIYSVTVSDELGCESVSEIEVIVNPQLDLILPDMINVCKDEDFDEGDPDYIVCVEAIGGTPDYTFQWIVPPGLEGIPGGLQGECFLINELTSSEFAGNSEGEYVLVVEVTDEYDCVATAEMIVQITGDLTLILDIIEPQCNETEATISATGFDPTGNPISSFLLYGGCSEDGSLGDFLEESSPSNGTYQFPTVDLLSYTCYTIVGQTETGCQVVESIDIDILEGTSLDISGNTTICQGEEAVITIVNDSLFTSFSWTPDVGNTGTVTVLPDTTTTYLIEAIDNFGCTSQEIFTVNVEPANSPICADPCENQIADFQITGIAFSDHNGNGIQDAGEAPLSNVLVKDVVNDFTVFTNIFGVYVLPAFEGDVIIEVSISQGQWMNPLINDIVIVDIPCVENTNYGFIPMDVEADNINISVANTITRCDWETNFFITVENLNHDEFEGTVEFMFDSKVSFFSSDINSIIVTGNKAVFETGTLDGFSPKTFVITLKMPGGSANLPELFFQATVSNGEGPLDVYSYTQQLRCSFDPNDKRTFPDRPGEDNITLKEESLEYTIRFQNNGNDTAFHVRLVDVIDPSILIPSIRFLNASHPFDACIMGDTLIIDFPNINLVDSTTNYDASQGFISLSCSIDPDVTIGTEINNTVDIIFDTNPPIITNTTLNTIVEVLCTDVTTSVSEQICEGESFMGYEDAGTYQDTIITELGCDSIIVLDLTVVVPSVTNIDLFMLCQGQMLDTLGIISEIDSTGNYSFTKEGTSGCIEEVINIYVELTEADEVYEAFNICKGDLLSYENVVYEFDSSGLYVYEFFDENECVETILQLDIIIIEPVKSTSEIIGCDEISVSFQDVIYEFDSTGVYSYFIEGETGCDEIELIFDVVIYETTYSQTDTTICEGQSYEGYEVEGTYTIETENPETGCLNFETLNLTVLPLSDPDCTVGIEEVDADDIKIQPIPAFDRLYIESPFAFEKVTLFSSTGILAFNTDQIHTKELKIEVSDFPNGFYFMLIEAENKSFMKKVIITK